MAQIRNPLHYEIVPSPGTNNPDWITMEEKIEMVLPFTESIHIDLKDGKFAPDATSLDPTPFKKYANDVILEAHLMVEDPIQYLKPFADAGFKRIVAQIEKMPDIVEFVAQGQLLCEIGLAIDGPTELEGLKIDWDDLDFALFYTGERAGFSGATMRFDRLEKVKKLRNMYPELPIEIDGGVNDENITVAKDAGVTRFVTTGYLYKAEDKASAYKRLQELILPTE